MMPCMEKTKQKRIGVRREEDTQESTNKRQKRICRKIPTHSHGLGARITKAEGRTSRGLRKKKRES